MLYGTLLQAQERGLWDRSDVFTTQDGLPHNTITALYQDVTGYLWIGTSNGLCRYDGIDFTTVNIPLKGGGHWSQVIETIYQDESGRLWLCTRAGEVVVWDTYKNKWDKKFSISENTGFVNYLQKDGKGKLWFGTSTGRAGYYLEAEDSLYSIQIENGIRDIRLDKNGELWIMSHLLVAYHLHPESLKGLPLPPFFRKHQKHLSLVGTDCEENLLIHLGGAFFQYHVDTDSVIEIPGFAPSSGYPDKPLPCKRMYSFNHTLYILNQEPLSIEMYDAELPFTSPEVLEDQSGLLWFATNHGLYKMDRKKHRFRNYSPDRGKVRIQSDYIRALRVHGDSVWLGFKGAWPQKLIYNTVKGDFTFKETIPIMKDGESVLSNPTINTYLVTRQGEVWCGGLEGLFKLDRTRQRFYPEPAFPGNKPGEIPEIFALCEDSKNRIWVGEKDRGLWVIDGKGEAEHLKTGAPDKLSIWDLLHEADGIVWAGTNKGLYRITEDSDHNFHYEPVKGLEGTHIWDIKTNGRGDYFLASTDQGFYGYHVPSQTLKHYTTGQGLPSMSVCSLESDSLGNVWIGTVNGLCRFHVASHTITCYYEEDGLISNDFNFSVSGKHTSGQLFFGTKGGVVSFNPQQPDSPQSVAANLVINSFEVNGRERMEGLHLKRENQLQYYENTVHFRFSLLEFSRPAQYRYRYTLMSFDREWKETNGRLPVATYTNLPPDDYVFKVEASLDGISWPYTNTYNFVIRPALWQRKWFFPVLFLGVFLIVTGTVLRVMRAQLKKERKKSEIEKALAYMELKALQAQMNPHFIFNAIHSVQQYMLRGDLLAANDYLTRFARLIRYFLEASINRKVPLSEEIRMLKLFVELEALRFDSRFDFITEIPPEEQMDLVEIPSMILQPFVENAIQHGLTLQDRKGKLFLSIDLQDHEVTIIVEDNGIGRERAKRLKNTLNQKQKSRGIELITERLKAYNALDKETVHIDIQDLHHTNGEPSGTRVIIILKQPY